MEGIKFNEQPIATFSTEIGTFVEKADNCILQVEKGWYISYAPAYWDGTGNENTAVVVEGADSIGVMFLCLKGDHRNDFVNVINEYKDFNGGRFGLLGECIRFACKHSDFMYDRSTIGGPFSKVILVGKK